ncbi:MAG TPA: metalloregulator ArsR/SmtB family transcription factor [Verrucomicrobiae bacterium]|nr:metalloregulator ArsR/SmtB family transcription factor [Verrucomicrobiae bacterium]
MISNLDQTFSALADPTRRAMIARLSRGEADVSDIARPFLRSMSLPAVTKHLKVLERAGLITKTRVAQRRPCKLNAAPLKEVEDWTQQYRAFWEESFDRLEVFLKTVTTNTTKKGKKNVRNK